MDQSLKSRFHREPTVRPHCARNSSNLSAVPAPLPAALQTMAHLCQRRVVADCQLQPALQRRQRLAHVVQGLGELLVAKGRDDESPIRPALTPSPPTGFVSHTRRPALCVSASD